MLTAYKVYLNDGSDYVTNMAEGITIDDARKYFVGQWFTEEDYNGKETHRQAINVQEVK